jgi:2-oxoglutarate dehydrogenase E2 component (dihydrolipoamide succinyltransferase)
MAYSVAMPALGESVTEGTVTRWLKREGERVEVDEPLVEISTDKVDTEIPSPASGVLQRIIVTEDETVQVGAELAVIGDAPLPSGPSRPDSDHYGREQPSPSVAAPRPSAPPSAAKVPVTMPALGESVTSGTVTRWLKRVGERVEVDEPLLEISTDKVDTEIPAPTAGTLLEILVGEDETAAVGATLATIGQVETAASPPGSERPGATVAATPTLSASPVTEPSSPSSAPYVTPLVRKLAAEHGVDLSRVQGTGVGGRIRKQDVLAAVETSAPAPTLAPAPQPAAESAPVRQQPAVRQQPRPSPAPSVAASGLRGRTEKMSRMRSVIAKRMVESLQISAQLTTVVEVDITRLARLRDRAKRDFEAREGVKLSFLPFFAQATVEALKQHPKLNASIDTDKGEITYHDAEHLGIAVDTERGLLVPVIHDAGDLNITGLARRIADLAARTRANKITPDEMSGGTFTISNTGSRGALFDTPIILQPQVGILGTGTVVKRPAVLSNDDGDSIAIRSIIYLALSYDHRLVDGADAARFLNTIKQRLTDAAFERDLGL